MASTSPPAEVTVLDVAAQPCTRPTRDLGVGFLVGDGLVATAAHTVEGPRRLLTVAGRPARVVLLDVRLDLAVLAADVDGEPATWSFAPVGTAVVVTPAGRSPVEVVSTGPLVVDNVTDRTRVRREVHTFTPGVAPGTSGAPLVDADGRVVGMVQLDRGGADLADAVTAAELVAGLEGVTTDVADTPACDG